MSNCYRNGTLMEIKDNNNNLSGLDLVLYIFTINKCRSSRPDVFCKKNVLRNFAKFTGKHLVPESFF